MMGAGGYRLSPAASSDSTLGAVLDEAKALICGDRRTDYGEAMESFTRIAEAWQLIFKVKITPQQVALAMVMFKVCREVNTHKHDNLVDICGYAALADYLNENK